MSHFLPKIIDSRVQKKKSYMKYQFGCANIKMRFNVTKKNQTQVTWLWRDTGKHLKYSSNKEIQIHLELPILSRSLKLQILYALLLNHLQQASSIVDRWFGKNKKYQRWWNPWWTIQHFTWNLSRDLHYMKLPAYSSRSSILKRAVYKCSTNICENHVAIQQL